MVTPTEAEYEELLSLLNECKPVVSETSKEFRVVAYNEKGKAIASVLAEDVLEGYSWELYETPELTGRTAFYGVAIPEKYHTECTEILSEFEYQLVSNQTIPVGKREETSDIAYKVKQKLNLTGCSTRCVPVAIPRNHST